MVMTVAVSGHFNPLHEGHIQLFKEAKDLGDKLIVIINSDEQTRLKKGYSLMSENSRATVISNLKMVDEVFIAQDKDSTVCEALQIIKPDIFANGGDRKEGNIPEADICDKLGIKMINNVGGDKLTSSTDIIKNFDKERGSVERLWGRYKILYEGENVKAKILTIDPGKSLSYQKHFKREEYWRIISGEGIFSLNQTQQIVTPDNTELRIWREDWHAIENDTDKPIIIFEIQKGSELVETDIIRKDNPL